jgi:hypothetical protein
MEVWECGRIIQCSETCMNKGLHRSVDELRQGTNTFACIGMNMHPNANLTIPNFYLALLIIISHKLNAF